MQAIWITGSLMASLLALSAFFSGAETALFSLDPATRRRIRRRKKSAVARLTACDPVDLLSSVLLGNLAVNILFFCTGAAWAGREAAQRGGWTEAAAGGVILLSVIVFGELVPKAVGVNRPEQILRWAAGPLLLWFRFTAPAGRGLRRVLSAWHLLDPAPAAESALTPGELRELIRAVHDEPGFGSREKQVLEGLIALPDVRAREIMTPRVHVLRRPIQTPRSELLDEACRKKNEYVLLYRASDDDPAGYVRLNDLRFAPSGQPTVPLPLIRRPLFVPEAMRADALLRCMLGQQAEFVVVVDEYGGLAGTISLDRLPDALFDVPDGEAPGRVDQLDERSYRLDAGLPVRAWRDLFAGFLPGPEIEAMAFETLGGLMISLLGRMPQAGDRITVRNLHLTVESMHHRRIKTVLLHLATPEESP